MSARSTLAAFMLAVLALAAAPASAGDSDIVEVPLDVDIYDKPADESTKRPQFLKGGTQVLLMQKNSDDWCQIATANAPIPGGTGWIWCGMGDDGKNYAVKPVVAETPAEPETPPMGGGAGGGGGGAAEPIKYDCKIIGPNEGTGGGSADPKVTFKCVDIGDGKKECCFYKQP
jgi:hypothetical protein